MCVSVQRPEVGGGHDWGKHVRFQGGVLQRLCTGPDHYPHHRHDTNDAECHLEYRS